MDVYFYEAFEEEELALNEHLPDNVQAQFTPKTIQEQGDAEPPAGLISIRTQSCIPADWADKIEGVLTRSQGYDHLTAYCRETGAKFSCGFLDNYCSRSVAEHAFMAMMVLLRRLKRQIDHFDRFKRDGLTGSEFTGKNLLVIGVGKIGSEMVDIGRGLKMSVKGVDIDPGMEGMEYVALEKGIVWADVVFSAVPLTVQTEGMLNYAALKQAKPSLVLVNVSRGEVTPVEDLKRLLDEERISGLSLDVYEQESVLAGHLRGQQPVSEKSVEIVKELKERDNVLFTPHNAFNTAETVELKSKQSAESVVQFLKKRSFPHHVPGV